MGAGPGLPKGRWGGRISSVTEGRRAGSTKRGPSRWVICGPDEGPLREGPPGPEPEGPLRDESPEDLPEEGPPEDLPPEELPDGPPEGLPPEDPPEGPPEGFEPAESFEDFLLEPFFL